MPRRSVARGGLLVAAVLGALSATSGCHRKHVRVASVPEIPYPSCGAQPLPPGEVLAAGHLRSGPEALEQSIVERYELRRRDCLYVSSSHQEWPLGIADVEVVYDANLLPLRAWRRTAIPGVPRADGSADTRRYEFRTPEVTIKRRTPEGRFEYEILRGGRPRAVIGPGRGLLTAWIRRAQLPVGGRLREWVLDIRPQLEELHEVTLIREDDQYVQDLGRTVRVYTIYGREPVFTDESGAVLGDMAGLRPSALVHTPEPAPMPDYGAPDPVHTP
jgi:hypothetical protein